MQLPCALLGQSSKKNLPLKNFLKYQEMELSRSNGTFLILQEIETPEIKLLIF